MSDHELSSDTHPAEWEVDGEWIAGELDLSPSQPPRGDVFGVPTSFSGVRSFPHSVERGFVRGRLRSGRDVLLGGTTMSVWFPGRALLFPKWALVGLGIHNVASDLYSTLRVQITGLETFFGSAPIESMTWPADDSNRTFSVTAREPDVGSWAADGVEIHCAYEVRPLLGHSYKFNVAFAPVVEARASPPLGVDDWIDEWMEPLLGLVALATGSGQNVALASLGHEVIEDFPGREPQERVRFGDLFAAGISQKPALAETPEFLQGKGADPVFTLPKLARPLPAVIARWRELRTSADPFLELYGPMLFDTALPPRARTLHLFQALEALHGYEHRESEHDAQERYRLRRTEVLDHLRDSDLPTDDIRFIRGNWTSRRPDSLARRLKELIDWLPTGVRDEINSLASTPLGIELSANTNGTVEELLQNLRNDLAHGNTNPAAKELRPFANGLDRIARIHLLRLLGFTQDDVRFALAGPETASD